MLWEYAKIVALLQILALLEVIFKVIFVTFMLSSDDKTLQSVLLENEMVFRYSANEVWNSVRAICISEQAEWAEIGLSLQTPRI